MDLAPPAILLGGPGLPESPRWLDGPLVFPDIWGGAVAAAAPSPRMALCARGGHGLHSIVIRTDLRR